MIRKIIITFATILYTVPPLLADLNASHLLNPDWHPHARVHLAWLLATNTCIAIVSLWVLWMKSKPVMASVLGLCVMAGFWISLVTSSMFGGSITPTSDFNAILGVPGNVFLFGVIVILLLIGLILRERNE